MAELLMTGRFSRRNRRRLWQTSAMKVGRFLVVAGGIGILLVGIWGMIT